MRNKFLGAPCRERRRECGGRAGNVPDARRELVFGNVEERRLEVGEAREANLRVLVLTWLDGVEGWAAEKALKRLVVRTRSTDMAAAVVQGATLLGAAMLACFAIGYSLPLAAGLVGLGIGLGWLGRFAGRVAPVARICGGVVLLGVGFYLLSGA